MNYIDLHVHTTASDGTFTPAEVVRYAIEKKLSKIAITDHDTIDGLKEALEAAEGTDLEVICGVELSTEYHGRDVHIVGLDVDRNNPDFLEYLDDFIRSRDIRNKKMVDGLAAAGYPISIRELLETYTNSVITRAHVARLLHDKQVIPSISWAFDHLIGDHSPYYIPREKVTPEDGVRLIMKAGGIPILAHPMIYKMTEKQLSELIVPLKELGLIGIEGIYSTYSPADDACVRRLAKAHGLTLSGGSDFHGANKPNLDLGTGYGKLRVPEDYIFNLRAAKAAAITGK